MKLAKAGKRPGWIIRELKLTKTFVYKWVGRAMGGGSVLDAARSGRPRKLDKKTTKRIARMMQGKKNKSVRKVAQVLASKGVVVGRHQLLPITRDLDYHWVYLADRSPIHTADAAQAWLAANVPEHVTPKQWPAHSPDLNPIENAWALLKNRVAAAEPKTLDELKKALHRAWADVMTPEYRQTLADSMKRRITACWAANGGSTKY